VFIYDNCLVRRNQYMFRQSRALSKARFISFRYSKSKTTSTSRIITIEAAVIISISGVFASTTVAVLFVLPKANIMRF